jgi:aspartokinase/homoserine dehydrogenase 1
MLVQKFGGTSLADLTGFRASAVVVKKFSAQDQVVAVFSAVAGVTDLLVEAIDAAVVDGDFAEPMDRALEREHNVLSEVQNTGIRAPLAVAYLDEQRQMLAARLEGVRLLGNCPDKVRAEILASGEGYSSRLMADLLAGEGVRVRWSDTDILPPANENWLDSLVDQDAAAIHLKEALTADIDVLVLPGFYGRNAQGAVQLLGRNGSDYSAASVAAALGASVCQIWKEVDGFFTADPRIVPNARCLDAVSFEEAMELSYFGAKVISSKALAPLAASGIPCEVRNTYKPEAPGTKVCAEADLDGPVRGLSLLDHVASITLEGGGMRGRVGIARRVMEALAGESISILLIVQSSSEYSITLCVRTDESVRALKALRNEFHFEQLHGLITDISVQTDRGVISLVGDGMKRNRGIAARFLTAISTAGVNVEVIAQGSNECAIAVVVTHDDAHSALRACHTAFFSHTSQIDVILLGCGNVGSALLAQIERQAEDLVRNHVKLNIRAIANSRKLLLAHDAIDPANWQDQMEAEGVGYKIEDVIAIRERMGLLNVTIVDCTTSETLAGQYTRFLANG